MGTPAHTVLGVQQFLTQNSMTHVPRSPYLHILAHQMESNLKVTEV